MEERESRIKQEGDHLKKLLLIVSYLSGLVTGVLIPRKEKPESMPVISDSNDTDKYMGFYTATYEMLYAVNHNLSIVNYLKEEGIHTIAVYGMGALGREFIQTLRNDSNYGDDFEIMFGIDRWVKEVDYGIDVISLGATLEKVDAIVVSLPYAFESIKSDLEAKPELNGTKIFSVIDVVKNDF